MHTLLTPARIRRNADNPSTRQSEKRTAQKATEGNAMRRDALWQGSAFLLLIALALLGVLLGTAWRRSHPRHAAPQLKVTFFDVGSGDCTLVRTPEGRAILLDAGGPQAGPRVVADLQRLGVRTIDLLILTSPDEKSIGGIPALLGSGIRVTQVWDNPVADAGDARRDALEAIRRRHVPASTAGGGDAIQIGEMLFVSAVWPPPTGPAARRDPLVCRINYGGTAFLFEAPATAEAERDLVGQADRQIECTEPVPTSFCRWRAMPKGRPCRSFCGGRPHRSRSFPVGRTIRPLPPPCTASRRLGRRSGARTRKGTSRSRPAAGCLRSSRQRIFRTNARLV